LFGGRQSITAAAGQAAAVAAVLVLVLACSGCGPQESANKASTRSLVTPTTQIGGAGVLGNDRKPDEACAHDAAAADAGPPNRQAHNVAGGHPRRRPAAAGGHSDGV